ncbi:ubiquitin carboxyl-terminal hydrolase 36 [Eurosta solidaginis]|uniref:ubiquitin carboxyl-terminal hydrolase 36 n=1 Tax=Eurosta solidaginis TaxID=178769 RepID=UPI0035315451
MPVSVVCEPVPNVSAVLRESLGNGYSTNSSRGGVCGAKSGSVGDNYFGADDDGCLQTKLAVTAKRVLLSKIEYEEVTNYGQSVLGALKSKYEQLKSTANNKTNYDYHSIDKCSTENYDANGNTIILNNASNANASTSKRHNPNELPQPKRVLYPRENVIIGWKNSVRKWQVGVGMMNVGNTCYLNSTLQALFHVPSLANWLLSDAKHTQECESPDNCIICAMVKTLEASQTNQSAIRPYLVYSKLKFICKHLLMGRQEDAHEFLRYLVEAMEKSYLTRYRNYKELEQYSKETTPLNQILGGYLKSAVRCLACGHVSVTFQHFQDLLLDIRKADTVEEALEGYFSRERLEDMGYKCEACKKKVSATKQFSLERAPIVLCIQLKRFSVMGTKLNKQITIKPRIDLSKFVTRKDIGGEQLTYKLVAMVTHLGASQHCGHYTAIGLTESGTYYNYDDSYVRPISVQNVCNTNAYIIFYEIDKAQRTPSCTELSSSNTNISAIKENIQRPNGYNKSEHLFSTEISNTSNTHQQQRYDGNLLSGGIKPPSSSSTHHINKTNTNNGSINNNNNKFGTSRQIHFKNQLVTSTTLKFNAATTTTTATKLTMHPEQNINNLQRTAEQHSNHALETDNTHQTSYACRESLSSPSTSNKRAVSIASENEKKLGLSNNNENRLFSATDAKRNKLSEFVTTTSPPKANTSTLPSMPILFDVQNSRPTTTTTSTATKYPTLPVSSPLKSLVPYESETDEESTASEIKDSLVCTDDASKKKKDFKSGVVKRTIVDSPAKTAIGNSDNMNGKPKKINFSIEDDCGRKPNIYKNDFTNNEKLTTNNTQDIFYTKKLDELLNTNRFKIKHKTDMFHEHHDSSINTQNMSTNDYHNPLINKKDNELIYDEDAISAAEETRPQFQRSHSTPPSPPVIKTKTGLWQVTTLQPVTACVSPPEKKMFKNPKNPFAKKTPEAFNKRQKSNSDGKLENNFVGNGYRCSNVDDNCVAGLMKQSHRGYGVPVLSWKGDQPKLSKEVESDAQQQRKNDWQNEEDVEIDRGRQKKVKSLKDSQQDSRIPGYNPFQEEDNQRRWRFGGGPTQRHYNNGYVRNQFQRNKFKFQRFNQKFQRMTAVSYMRNNYRLNQQNYSRRNS